MKLFLTLTFCFSLTLTAFAQYPATNIYVMNMNRVGNDHFKFTDPIFLNSDNKGGYNNQPYFMDDNRMLVTSQRDDKQTDIYMYNFENLTVTQLTNTPEMSEFSPAQIPNENAISTVNIEVDGKTQRVWKYPMKQNATGSVMTEKVENVGYYDWIDDNRMAMFIIDNPNHLEIVNVNTQRSVRYATNIGRCMKQLSNGDLCYVQKSEEGEWFLKRLDIRNLDIVTIASTLSECEDFAILPDDTILMGKGDKLYKLNADRDKQWSMVGDFKSFNINKITRISITENKIAIVADSL